METRSWPSILRGRPDVGHRRISSNLGSITLSAGKELPCMVDRIRLCTISGLIRKGESGVPTSAVLVHSSIVSTSVCVSEQHLRAHHGCVLRTDLTKTASSWHWHSVVRNDFVHGGEQSLFEMIPGVLSTRLRPSGLAHPLVFVGVLEHPVHGTSDRTCLRRIVQKQPGALMIHQLWDGESSGRDHRTPKIPRLNDQQRRNIALCRMH